MRTLIRIGKWMLFTPLILLAGLLNLDDYVLLLKDIIRGKQQHEGQQLYNQIEKVHI
ncbi:hypothetical protein [Paenibacillus dauci]|uniref:hypothetical protein n=1 Tax=Paenibacillus dauci TaxID=1567106 RepID=UPI000A7096D6|nr:hypothetical protein [Paenibacillus dauci]